MMPAPARLPILLPRVALLLLCLAPAACGTPPKEAGSDPVAASGKWPELVPLGPVLKAVDATNAAPDPTAAEKARADALRARAAALRAADS